MPNSASSICFAGFQLHIASDDVPARVRGRIGLAGEITRAERPALADLGEYPFGQPRVARLDVAMPLNAVPTHALARPREERPDLGRREAQRMDPALDDPSLAQEPRDGALRVDACAARDRDPVASVDR